MQGSDAKRWNNTRSEIFSDDASCLVPWEYFLPEILVRLGLVQRKEFARATTTNP